MGPFTCLLTLPFFLLTSAAPTIRNVHLPLDRHLAARASNTSVGPVASQQPDFSGDVTQCQGYAVDDVRTSSTGGLLASLSLISECNAYGTDIRSLTLSVEYDTPTRLHVHIYDTELHQYQIPDSVWPRPAQKPCEDSEGASDLSFNYDSSPFAFWVTRKSDGVTLFDTRQAGIPTYDAPVEIEGADSNYTVMPAHPLVFEDQYLQISSALPSGTNIYGLGEVVSGSGYRRNESGTVQTFWARDVADPVDENMYGSHAMYMEARLNESTNKLAAHGVFLLNSNGMDVILRDGVIEYRPIGGTLDFYFFSGPTPNAVAEQYAQAVGLPQAMPEWAFGFHLCRWGYTSIAETKSVVQRMRDAGIPLETQWNDIDWMRHYRQFQFDQNFQPADYKAFVDDLHANNQHYIPIIDGAIGILYNDTDSYDVYTRGHELDVWMKNPDGTEYIGDVWPGWTVFPDWLNPNMQTVWYEAFYNLSQVVDFDGIWLDMNEPSSFVDGSATNSTVSFAQTTLQEQDYSNVAAQTEWPEGYTNVTGTSGNVTVDGELTYGADGTAAKNTALRRRQTNGYVPQIPFVDEPPYPIRNGAGRLSAKTVSPNATHYGGLQEYNVHNLWGTMEEFTTNNVLQALKPGLRPFIVGRSTFASAGRKTAHWLGDNYSTFAYMKRAIQGVLQFNLFAIPMVGPDTCGFNGNTDEDLCNRWMQLSAFFPFYRNHNIKNAISQEPYVWDSVRDASIKAIKARYQLLPYWLTLFAEASQYGTPPVRALFHEFPSASYLSIDAQFLIGPSVLVTPVLQPNESTVQGIFPSDNGVFWVDWWTHERVDTSSSSSENVTLTLPLGHIGVHVRSGSALLIYDEPGYTTTETKDGGYGVLVVMDGKGYAEGGAKVDDGASLPVTDQTCLTFTASDSCLTSTPSASASNSYYIPQKLKTITLVGVATEPSTVTVNGKQCGNVEYKGDTGTVVISGLDEDLNDEWQVKWY